MTGNIQIDQLVRTLFQKDNLDQCSLQELEQFAGRHPYFGAAQLLLAKKMQLENSAGYEEQLQKTYLFFHNPLWVRRLLGDRQQELNGQLHIAMENPATEDQVSPTLMTPAIEAETVTPEPEDPTPVKQVVTPPVAAVDTQETSGPGPELKEDPQEQAAAVVTPGNKKENPEEALVFEPFHTVDYFASQGIRYKPEEKPRDKFGQQLKSFTDWLKVMKRLPVNEMMAQAEPGAEKKVEQLAERSLQEKDVLTEAMADVWIKQGNREKAREIYRKLSLLDPSKSAYFASKIEALQ